MSAMGRMNATGFLRATVEIARQTVLLLMQNRLLWVVGAAQLAMPALSYLLGGSIDETHTGRHDYALTTWTLFVFVLVPWTTLYCGVQAVHGDIEDRTFQYLFLRPVPRASILLGKLLAVAALSTALFCFGAAAWFLGFAARTALWPDGVEFELVGVYAQAIAMAAAAYAAIAVLFAARLRRPLVWGACFIVGLEVFVGNLPSKASIRYLTITDPVRRFLLDRLNPDRRLARELWPWEHEFKPELVGQPVLNLAILAAVATALALWFYTRSEYDSRERE
jgi:ABC-type transport system involved in multi-copper enzyme maturation permease subunit